MMLQGSLLDGRLMTHRITVFVLFLLDALNAEVKIRAVIRRIRR